MRIVFRLLTAIVLCLPANESVADEGVVVARDLAIFDRPESDAFEVGALAIGARVVVVKRATAGLLAIQPPDYVFNWIDEEAIRPLRESNRARVVAARARVRSGRIDARLPGPPKTTLERGDIVELVDVAPLRVRFGDSRRAWRAIAPAADELFYVPAEGIELVGKRPRAKPVARKSAATVVEPDLDTSMRIDDSLAKLGPRAAQEKLPDAIEAAIRSAEDEHRALLRAPIEEWRTAGVARLYQRILDQKDLPAAAATIVRGRLVELKRQEEAGREASAVDDLLRRGRDREAGAVAGRSKSKSRSRRADLKKPRPFDAVGLLQPSSKLHDGEKVFALVAGDGLIAAYVDVPPGYDMRPLIARRVGVRGEMRYDENIGGKLVLVNELEWLEDED